MLKIFREIYVIKSWYKLVVLILELLTMLLKNKSIKGFIKAQESNAFNMIK